MPENLFRDVVQSSIQVGSKQRYTLPVSLVTHTLVVGAAIVIVPILGGDILPMPPTTIAFVATTPPPTPPPPPAPPRAAVPRDRVMTADPTAAPLDAPSNIAPERQSDASTTILGPVEGVIDGIVGSFVDSVIPVAPPPPSPSAAAPVRVGSGIRQPTKIKDVRPIYPAIAQAAHVQGVVIIEATIGATGKVLDAKILRSIPLLDTAAIDAVRQWEYTPTLLNGIPVSVVMTVTVNFMLQ